MSFILDALRKSENQRHREIAPVLPESRIVSRESRMPLVLAGVAVLLVVNLAVLLALYLRREPAAPATPVAPAPAGAPGAGRVAGAGMAPTLTGAERSPAALRPLAEEAAADAPTESSTGSPIGSSIGSSIEPPPPLRARPGDVAATTAPRHYSDDAGIAAAAAAQQQAALEAAPGGATNHSAVPSINDLGPQATAGLPVLNVDLHVYATDPSQRFVIINGRRYPEGGRLPEGALVEHITPDGVIMNHKGTRFLLPRE